MLNIILIHGGDSVKSRQRLERLIDVAKSRSWDIVRPSDVASVDLSKIFSLESLFSKKKLYVFEEATKLSGKNLSWLYRHAKKLDSCIIFYSSNSLSGQFLSKIPSPNKNEKYDLPVIIFKFLESFYPGNSQRAVGLFHQTLLHQPPEFVFILLLRHIKGLLFSGLGIAQGDPIWKITKRKMQFARFGEARLCQIVHDLAEIDLRVKLSKTDIICAIDQLIIKKLQ